MPVKLTEFRASLRAGQRRRDALLLEIYKRVALDVAQNITVGGKYSPGTPVDTGFARGSWYPVFARSGSGTPTPGLGSFDDMVLRISGLTTLESIQFVNGAVYIRALEYGHSQQAPQGMVRLTLSAGQAILNDAVRNVKSSSISGSGFSGSY